MHFFGYLTGAVYLVDDYVWRTTQYDYRGQNREQREDVQAKPAIQKNKNVFNNVPAQTWRIKNLLWTRIKEVVVSTFYAHSLTIRMQK